MILFQNANNKGADQTTQMHRLVCAFVVREPLRQFSRVEAHIMLDILCTTLYPHYHLIYLQGSSYLHVFNPLPHKDAF